MVFDIGFVDRVMNSLTARVSGPMHFRLVIQPLVSVFFAVRAGLRDARSGEQPFGWRVLTAREGWWDVVREEWEDAGTLFIIAVILDVIYQLIEIHRVYPGEALLVATLLAFVPYLLLRGIANRFARRITRK